MPAVGYDPDKADQNENLLVWVENSAEWIHGPGVLGLTTLTYNTCNGKIVDGDIEINAGQFLFSVSDTPESDRMDLENTVTHEVGHLLGLDHSEENGASMFFNSPEAEIEKRSIEEDDWLGLCCLYCVQESHVPDNRCDGKEVMCREVGMEEVVPNEGTGDHEVANQGGCVSLNPSRKPFLLLILFLLYTLSGHPTRQEPV